MKISKLQINKYKSIKQTFRLDELGKLHIFIGENNAGKTNILDAIFQLYNKDEVRFFDKDTDITVSFQLNSKYGKKLEVKQTGRIKKFTLDNKEIDTKKAEIILSKHIIRIRATKPISSNIFSKDLIQFKHKYKKEFIAFCDTLIKYIPKIKITKELLDKKNIKENNIIRPFERLGDGFRQVFVILMYLFNPQFTILLLEEPEVHLHPALIKKLVKIIENKNIYNQLFLTTHSPLFIHTTNLHRLFRVTKEKGSTKVHSPRLVGRRLNYTRLTQELNAENTEMLFADKVLLVEGPSDHILMRSLIDRFYNGEKNIKVIQIYGKSNIDIYTELLEVFNIPYAVLFDRDAIYDTGIKLIQNIIKQNFSKPETIMVKMLKKYGIYVLPNGSIEKNYPRRYQRRRKHKPQNALYAASRITESEYNSATMRYLKEVIDNL